MTGRDPFEYTKARWEERQKKEHEDEIRRPVERRLEEAEKILSTVRTVIDRVMGDDRATNGETRLAEELDGIVPARPGPVEEPYVPSGQTMAALGMVAEPGEPGFAEPSKSQKKECLVCGEVVEDWPAHFRKHKARGVLAGHRYVFDRETLDGGKTPAEIDGSLLREVNSDDWAILRVAELRATGEKATFRVEWRTVEGQRQYRVTIRRADGSIERSPAPITQGRCPECQYDHDKEGPGAACLRARSLGDLVAECERRGVVVTTETQGEADLAQLLDSFTEEELAEELRRRGRRSESLRRAMDAESEKGEEDAPADG